jgi:hypothetical protein
MTDAAGRPWVSPVFFAADGYRDLYWISAPQATHSRNLAERPEASIVVFDSQAPVGTGQAVYMAVTADQVLAPAPYRLYRATVSQHWVLDPDVSPDQRTPVAPGG